MAENQATRNTIQRALVLDAVKQLHNHPTSADVYDVVREHHPNISRATVYRNLGVLASRGDVSRVRVPGGADRYDFRCDEHFHAVCRECGRVYDIEARGAADFLSFVGDTHGFEVDGCNLVLSGVCADCAQAR